MVIKDWPIPITNPLILTLNYYTKSMHLYPRIDFLINTDQGLGSIVFITFIVPEFSNLRDHDLTMCRQF